MANLKPSNAFLGHQPIIGVHFKHNDYVHVASGPHAGHKGSLVGLVTLDPEPVYVLESVQGQDINVLQSHIDLIKSSE